MSARPESFRSDSKIDALRVPPQSVEAEQAVIGGLMLAPDSLDRVGDLLTEEDFYRRDHRLIYRAIRELSEKNKPFDAVTLGEWLEANNLADQIGGTGYLIELASTTPSAANIRASDFFFRLGFADVVSEDYVAEQQFFLCNIFILQFVGLGHREGQDVGRFVLAAPLGVQGADVVVAGQAHRDLDRPAGHGEIGEGAFGDRRLGGLADQRRPGAATVPFLVGVEGDLEHHRSGPS